MKNNDAFLSAAQQLIAAGHYIDSRGWVPATSGNFSIRLPNGTIAITVSGRHKGRLAIDDIMLIDATAQSLDGKKPSAETLLHTSLYKHYSDIQSILHPHTLNATLISKVYKTEIILKDYELLKAFNGIDTHETQIVVPIFANDQNIARLAGVVEDYLAKHNDCYAYIIAGHGLYTWGRSVDETLRYLEALDFLFECELHLHGVKN